MNSVKYTSNSHAAVIGCLIALLAPIALCATLLWVQQLYNDRQLQRFARNLFNHPPPPQTEVISRNSEVGLMGNGNHCDFLVTQTMRTRLSQSEIEAYYDEVRLPPVNRHNEGIAPAFQGQHIPVFIDFDDSVKDDGWQQFTIRLVDYGHNPGIDFRCH